MELDVVGSKGYCFPVWRYAGVREWQYCQVDGQIVSLPDAVIASQFLDEVCAGLAGVSALGSCASAPGEVMRMGCGVICALVALGGLFILFGNLPVCRCAAKMVWFLFGVVLA